MSTETWDFFVKVLYNLFLFSCPDILVDDVA